MKKIKSCYYFIFIILFLEMLLHYFCFKEFNILNKILFCIPISLVLDLFCNCFKTEKINKTIFLSLIVLASIFYTAELIYFKIYESFFSISAVGMAEQITDAFDQIITVILNNILPVICILIVPILLSVIFMIDWGEFKKYNLYNNMVLLITILILYGSSLILVFFDKGTGMSNYEIYNYKVTPVVSVQNFGLLTTLRLDIKKKLFPKVQNLSDTNIQEEIVYNEINKYNVTNIEFEDIINKETNEQIKEIHEYFNNQQASNKNEYTGMFKEKNVVFILAESLYSEAISAELTPTLYKMQQEGLTFNNYYVPLYPTSTADGEYMTEWSLYPIINNSYNLTDSAKNYNPYGFVNAFKDEYYYVSAYHGYTSSFYNRYNNFKNNGYEKFEFCNTGLNIRCEGLHASDLEMVKNSIDFFINKEKFFTYYISISGHGSYLYNNNFIIKQNWELVKDLNYSDTVKGYIAATIELDKSLEYLISELEKVGKLEDTVFVITPDHWPYYFKTELKNFEKLVGNQIYNKFTLHKNNLIIYNNKIKEPLSIDKVSSNIDVLPTLLNLMGIDYDSRLLIGTDILSDKESIVIFPDYSWISELGTYDGKEFVPNYPDITVNKEYIETINEIVKRKIQVSALVQENDYYKVLFEQDRQIKLDKENKNELKPKEIVSQADWFNSKYNNDTKLEIKGE